MENTSDTCVIIIPCTFVKCNFIWIIDTSEYVV